MASAKTFASISSNSVGNDGAVELAGALTEQRTLLTLRSVWMRRSRVPFTTSHTLYPYFANIRACVAECRTASSVTKVAWRLPDSWAQTPPSAHSCQSVDKEAGCAHLVRCTSLGLTLILLLCTCLRFPSLHNNFIQKKAMIVLNREMKKNHSLTHFEISVEYVRQQSDGQPMANTVDLIHDPSV